MAESDSPVGSVLLRSIEEVGAGACVVVAANKPAQAAVESWLAEHGALVVTPGELEPALPVDLAYAIRAAEVLQLGDGHRAGHERDQLLDARMVCGPNCATIHDRSVRRAPDRGQCADPYGGRRGRAGGLVKPRLTMSFCRSRCGARGSPLTAT